MRGEDARLCSALVSITTREKPAVLQLATDQGRIVVAVRRACQKARRIVRKNLCESIRHIIRKDVLLDAIPYVEQKMSSGLQDSPCFAVARCAVGKEHRAELATNEIEGRIFKRQRQSIGLAPFDPTSGGCRDAA